MNTSGWFFQMLQPVGADMFVILGDSPDGPTGEVRSGIAAGVATLAATLVSELREFLGQPYYDYSRECVFVKVTCGKGVSWRGVS